MRMAAAYRMPATRLPNAVSRSIGADPGEQADRGPEPASLGDRVQAGEQTGYGHGREEGGAEHEPDVRGVGARVEPADVAAFGED